VPDAVDREPPDIDHGRTPFLEHRVPP
jgi:hypothetical protein